MAESLSGVPRACDNSKAHKAAKRSPKSNALIPVPPVPVERRSQGPPRSGRLVRSSTPPPMAEIASLDFCHAPIGMMEHDALDIAICEPISQPLKRPRHILDRAGRPVTVFYKKVELLRFRIALHLRADQFIRAIRPPISAGE